MRFQLVQIDHRLYLVREGERVIKVFPESGDYWSDFRWAERVYMACGEAIYNQRQWGSVWGSLERIWGELV